MTVGQHCVLPPRQVIAGVEDVTLSFRHDCRGRKVQATDGPLGRVRDVYFDDESWRISYVVVAVRGWTGSAHLLVEPAVLQLSASTNGDLVVAGSREVMRRSPSIEVDQPVSMQKLEERRRLHSLQFYTDVGLTVSGERPRSIDGLRSDMRPGDLHLRSCRAVTGYRVMARDGAAGKVYDFVLDTDRWTVAVIVVRATMRFGRPRVIPPPLVTQIDWESSTVEIAAERAEILRPPGSETPPA